MKDAPRYVTLSDYVRVLREQRRLILLITVVLAGLAVAVAVRQDPVYEAEASIQVNDPSSDAFLTGLDLLPQQIPQTRAAITASSLRQVRTLDRVRRALKGARTRDEIFGSITAAVEVSTNFVVLRAKDRDADIAARIANEFARQSVIVTNLDARRQFANAAKSLRTQQRRLRGSEIDTVTRALYGDRIARLLSLSRFAEPATVAKEAAAPSSPTSPRPVRNGILGAIIGLTLALIAAFVRDSLDRRLRSAREIQDQLDMPLLGVVREAALGYAGPVQNGSGRMSPEDLEAFRILRTNFEFLDVDRPLRTVVVTSALQEEGKSTVAASLAFASAAAGRKTLLVECDLRRPSLAPRLGLERSVGLAEYLNGQAEPADILHTLHLTDADALGGTEDVLPKVGESLVCITSGDPPQRPAELLGSRRFEAFLEHVKEAYDLVVLDSAPLLAVVDTLEILPHVDAVLVCVRAQRTTRDQARAARRAIDHLPERPTGLVVTGVRHGDEAAYGYYYAYTHRD